MRDDFRGQDGARGGFLLITVVMVIFTLLIAAGCTESSTQWGHIKYMQQQCRDNASTEAERAECER